MASFEQYGGSLFADKFAGQRDVVLILDLHTGEDLRLEPVGGNQFADWKEFLLQCSDEVIVAEGASGSGHHDRIHNERDVMVLEDVRYGLDYLCAVQHTGFDCLYVAVFQHRFELGLYEIHRHWEDAVDTLCVLGGDGCDHGSGVYSDDRHGFDIYLDTCTADGVRASHCKSCSHCLTVRKGIK